MALGFLDTNVLIYAFSTDPRSAIAERLLLTDFAIAVQGLNEFANVARRKLAMSWRETNEALDTLRTLAAAIQPLDFETHLLGMEIAERHGLSVFDASMLAAALRIGCETFWSEDMQHGFVLDEGLQIENPFSDGSALR